MSTQSDIRVLTIRQPWASLLAGWRSPDYICEWCGGSFSVPLEAYGYCRDHRPVRKVTRPKTIETRSKPTKHRGPVIIRAGLGKADHADPVWAALADAGMVDNGRVLPPLSPMQFGAVLGVVDLVDCLPISDVRLDEAHCYVAPGELWLADEVQYDDSGYPPVQPAYLINEERPYGDFTPGRFAWITANPRPLDQPIPWKPGQLGLTRAPAELLDLIRGDA